MASASTTYPLGGSWVVISGVLSRATIPMTGFV